MSARNGSRLVREAFELHRAGRIAEARALYGAAIGQDPGNVGALGYCGLAELQLGAPEKAVALLERAVALNAGTADFHANLGEAYRALGRLDAAIASFRCALALEPGNVHALNNLALAHLDKDAPGDAETALRAALDIRAEFAPAWANLSVVQRRAGDLDAAYESARRAVDVEDGSPIAQGALADVLAARGDSDGALIHYAQAMALAPERTPAIVAYAVGLKEVGRIDESTALLRRAVARAPRDVSARYNLGVNLYEQGDIDAAIEAYRAVIALAPDHVMAQKNLAVALLLEGAFAEGFDRWEWRWREPDTWARHLPLPFWQGEPLSDTSLLVWGEQGVGDEIMLASVLPEVIAAASRVAVECDPRLVPLFERAFPRAEIVARQNMIDPRLTGADFDVQSALGGLCRRRRRTAAAFANPRAYLQADPAKTAEIRRRYRAEGEGPLIGIAWRSDGGSANRHRRQFKAAKSTDLLDWGPLLGRTPAVFVDLQYGDRAAEIAEAEARFGVRILQDTAIDQMRDLDDFAAQLAALDLIVSISSTTVHLAGALGLEVWALIAHVPDWRWQSAGVESLWYPRVRLLRQRRRGDWTGSIDEAVALLADRMRAGASQ